MAFTTYVVGFRFKNPDGSSRITILRKCREGEEVYLVREPHNPHDENAIAIFRESGEQLGYIRKQVAESLADRMDCGGIPKAIIKSIKYGSPPGLFSWLFGIDPTGYECQLEISGG